MRLRLMRRTGGTTAEEGTDDGTPSDASNLSSTTAEVTNSGTAVIASASSGSKEKGSDHRSSSEDSATASAVDAPSALAAATIMWKEAVDARSGRTYYYHTETRQSQWKKPEELCTPQERQIAADRERKQREFFAAMEANVLRGILVTDGAGKDGNKTSAAAEGVPGNVKAPVKAEPELLLPEGSLLPKPTRLVRTISTMDRDVLRELVYRVPTLALSTALPPNDDDNSNNNNNDNSSSNNNNNNINNCHNNGPFYLRSIREDGPASASDAANTTSAASTFASAISPGSSTSATATTSLYFSSETSLNPWMLQAGGDPSEGSNNDDNEKSDLSASHWSLGLDDDETEALRQLAALTEQMCGDPDNELEGGNGKDQGSIPRNPTGDYYVSDDADDDRLSFSSTSSSSDGEGGGGGSSSDAFQGADTPLGKELLGRNIHLVDDDDDGPDEAVEVVARMDRRRSSASAPRPLSPGRKFELPLGEEWTTTATESNPSTTETVPPVSVTLVNAPLAGQLSFADRPAPLGARRNTCGTIYVSSTMAAPDTDATIRCVCAVYRAHIVHSTSGASPRSELEEHNYGDRYPYALFDDDNCQVPSTKPPLAGNARPPVFRTPTKTTTITSPPTLDEVAAFYRRVFGRAKMEADCVIMSLIYVERLIKTTQGKLRPRPNNWQSLLFSCMVLASKVWDDLSMWNADFSQILCPSGIAFSLKRLNELEVAVLSALQYNVKVPASEYAKYYFLMRSMLLKSGLGSDQCCTPLDVDGARRLQQLSSLYQQRHAAAYGDDPPSSAAATKKKKKATKNAASTAARSAASSKSSASAYPALVSHLSRSRSVGAPTQQADANSGARDGSAVKSTDGTDSSNRPVSATPKWNRAGLEHMVQM